MTDEVNKSRRNLLLGTSVVGVVGAAFAAVPFIKSWLPSERAKAQGGPVQQDISKLEPGQMLSVMWRSQPVFVVNRDERHLQALPSLDGRLKDPKSESSTQPQYALNEHRSMKRNLLVAIGICTHLGCSPKYYPEMVSQRFDSEWKGGFYCPCHNSRFDMAGRVFSGSPASRNLDIPPYMFVDDNTLVVGVDQEEAA